MLRDYVRNLCLELELDPKGFETDDPNIYAFRVDQDLTVDMAQVSEGIFLMAVLSESPTRDEESVYFETVNANLWGQATYGNVIGMTDDSKFMTLSRYIEYDTSYQDFRTILEDFLNAASFWQKKIKAHV
ncbi:MAG: type III secretion system chaperone [Chlamydiia bacterium]|nr:type III secretion system chaperone [Chlamydiia bacterium]